MNRRRVLASAGTLSVGLVGCLERSPAENPDSPDDTGTPAPDGPSTPGEIDYEECDRDVIFYHELPDPLRREADAAFGDGEYVAEDVRLADAMDVEASYLVKGDSYYEPVVGDGGSRLDLRRDESPVLPTPRTIQAESEADETHAVTVTVRTSDGEVLADETVSVAPGESRRAVETGRVGTHELVAERDDGERAAHDFRVDPYNFDGWITVADLRFAQVTADLAPCPWSDR